MCSRRLLVLLVCVNFISSARLGCDYYPQFQCIEWNEKIIAMVNYNQATFLIEKSGTACARYRTISKRRKDPGCRKFSSMAQCEKVVKRNDRAFKHILKCDDAHLNDPDHWCTITVPYPDNICGPEFETPTPSRGIQTQPPTTAYQCPAVECPAEGPCAEGWERWTGLADVDGCYFCGECKKINCDFKLEECGREPKCDYHGPSGDDGGWHLIYPRDSTALFIKFLEFFSNMIFTKLKVFEQ